MFIKDCAHCGMTFQTKNDRKIYCCLRCRDRVSHIRRPKKYIKNEMRTFNCGYCGKECTTNRAKSLYCGRKCKDKTATQQRRDEKCRRDIIAGAPIDDAGHWGFITQTAYLAAMRHPYYELESTTRWNSVSV